MPVDLVSYYKRSPSFFFTTYGAKDPTKFGATIAACDPQSSAGKNKTIGPSHDQIERMTGSFLANGGMIRRSFERNGGQKNQAGSLRR